MTYYNNVTERKMFFVKKKIKIVSFIHFVVLFR